MKITNIILTSQNGGAEQVFLDYCLIQQKLGHEVSAIIKHDAPYADKLLELGVETKKIRNDFGFHDLLAINKIKNALDEFGSEALMCHAGRASFLARKAIKNRKIMQVCMNHSNNVKRSIGADLVISINKEIFFKTIDAGQNQEKSIIIENAINFDKSSFEKEINFQKEKISIGMMARFDRTKGYFEILEALKILNDNSQKTFVLKLAGDGYFRDSIEKKIADLKLENHVEFLGWIQDKKKFFSAIDVFVLPSLEETFGLVLLEAMQYKTPVISSDADGPRQILRDGIDGIITQSNPLESYPQRLADGILKIVNDEKQAKEMTQNASERLQEKYSLERLESDLCEVFGRVRN